MALPTTVKRAGSREPIAAFEYSHQAEFFAKSMSKHYRDEYHVFWSERDILFSKWIDGKGYDQSGFAHKRGGPEGKL